MQGIPPKNTKKKSQKIFSACGKPHGAGLLPFYIVDILIADWAAKSVGVTIADIQSIIAYREGRQYGEKAIQQAVNNIHFYCDNMEVLITHRRVGTTRAQAFSIKFKTEDHV